MSVSGKEFGVLAHLVEGLEEMPIPGPQEPFRAPVDGGVLAVFAGKGVAFICRVPDEAAFARCLAVLRSLSGIRARMSLFCAPRDVWSDWSVNQTRFVTSGKYAEGLNAKSLAAALAAPGYIETGETSALLPLTDLALTMADEPCLPE